MLGQSGCMRSLVAATCFVPGAIFRVCFLRRLVAGSIARLRPGGLLALEHGHDQADAVAALFADSGGYEPARCLRDLGGNPRVSYARTRG